MKAAAANKNTDLTPVTTERTAAEIARKKAGQNNQAVKAVRPLSKTKGN
jgi:stage V sporulation protein SpoVS